MVAARADFWLMVTIGEWFMVNDSRFFNLKV